MYTYPTSSQPLEFNDSDVYQLFSTIDNGRPLINWAYPSFKDFFDTYIISKKVLIYNQKNLEKIQELFSEIYYSIVNFVHVPTPDQNERIKVIFETIFNDTSHDNSIDWLLEKKQKILYPGLYSTKSSGANSIANVL